MSDEAIQSKRNAATGLGVAIKVKPPVDDEPAKVATPGPSPDLVASDNSRKGAQDGVLPVITKPVLRTRNVSGRVTETVYDLLDEAMRLTGRSSSYLISRMLEENLPQWIEMLKAQLGEEVKKRK